MYEWFESMDPKTSGLVLGGGGARGCYEIGAWKVLSENGLYFGCTAGTSIGALVGAMYVQGSLGPITDFVENLKPTAIANDLFAFPEKLGTWVKNRKEIGSFLSRYIVSGTGMDISPLKEQIDHLFSWPLFEHSPINFACMTFNVTKRRPETFYKSEMTAQNAKEIILASASCYPAFPPLEYEGNQYIDGGYWDNVPIDLAAKMGAKKILAINVEGPGLVLPVDPSLDVLSVKPMLPLGNFLDFTSESAMKNLNAGILDFNRLLGNTIGSFYSFEKSAQYDLDFFDGYLEACFLLNHLSIAQSEIESIVLKAFGVSKSDLSKILMEGRSAGLLLEALAYTAGVDVYTVWSYMDFLNTLHEKLVELEKTVTNAETLLPALRNRDLDHKKALYLIHAILKSDLVSNDTLILAAAIHPAETAMAWIWRFVEDLYE